MSENYVRDVLGYYVGVNLFNSGCCLTRVTRKRDSRATRTRAAGERV